jgi:cytochrome P450
MFYTSGNRDEQAFTDPWKFDISRKPNAQIAFGGGGPHFCLVSNFAAAVKRMNASVGCPVQH